MEVEKASFTPDEYRVKIRAIATQRRDEIEELVKMGIYDPQAALDYIDDPRKEQIIKRLEAREQAAMQAAAMQKGGMPTGGMG